MLTLNNIGHDALGTVVKLPGLGIKGESVSAHMAKFDLAFSFRESRGPQGTPDGIHGSLEFAADIFEPASAKAIADRLVRLLDAVITDPDRPVDRAEILDPAERNELVNLRNDTAAVYPSESSVHALFEEQAARTPDAVAVVTADEELTYQQLNARANRLAHQLLRLGLPPEGRIAVLQERSSDLVVSSLAILKAGGAYVPLDPNQPAARSTWILQDTAATALLTDRPENHLGFPVHIPVLRIDQNTPSPGNQPDTNPAVRTNAEQIAYVMYTSGSTGTPKGVTNTHHNVVHLAADHYWRTGNHDRVLMHSPYAFDASTFEIWTPLLTGGRIVTAPPGHLTPTDFANTITRHGVTALFVSAGYFRVLAEERPECFTGIREIWAGGDIVSPTAVHRVRQACPGITVANEYGPTETTVFSSVNPITPNDPQPHGTVPIGRPLWNTRLYVLDTNLQPVPPGTGGELYIAGSGLARGYLNRPELTAHRFIADPHGTPGTRMYRTGDLVRWRHDGQLEFLGRVDDQIKLRGFRVEPAEIEAVLATHPAITQASVILREDQPGDKRLVAYTVTKRPVSQEALRAHVGSQLPEYMVPAAFIALDTLPLTLNGKLDRRALPAPDYGDRTTGRPPRTPREEILCGLYADILHLPQVTIDDNFFQLGGDSIMSIQLVARARRAGLELSVRDVFQHKTVAALATVVTEAPETPVEAAGAGVGPMPLTPIMRQWLERGGPVGQYNQSRLVQVPAGLDGQALVSAVQAVLDGHDALRARLSRNGQEQFLDIAPRGAVSADACVSRVDAAQLDDAARRALIAEETSAARQRLDATRGELTQFVWFDQGASAPGLLLVLIHHLAVDGVSWRILVPDLAEAYREAQSGRVPDLPPVGTSMRGWALALAEAAVQPKWAGQTAFWRDMLGGPAMPLGGRPLDAERDVRDNAGHLSLRLPVAVTEAVLTRVPQVFHAEVNDVLLAAFTLAWARWRRGGGGGGGGGGDSVLLDLEGHGREESVSPGADLSRTVGWFTSHHPIRLDTGLGDEREIAEALAGGPAAGSVLKHVKERLRAVPDKGMGYGLVRYRNPQAAAEFAGLPVPEVSFNYLGRFTTAAAEDAGTFRAPDWTELNSAGGFGASDPRMPMAYKVDLVARTQDGPRGPQLTASWSWPRGLLDEADVQRLARLWFDALEGLTEHARQPDAGGMTPSDVSLSLLDQSEIEQLESDWRELS